jgi:hypothetical protein
MKTFRTSSDIYIAFCRDLRGNLHVLAHVGLGLSTEAIVQGNMVGLNLFEFVAGWGMDKKKAAQTKEYAESEAGVAFFHRQQLKKGSLFFRRMAVNTEPYEPYPTLKALKGRSPIKIISAKCHPSSSAITLGGNTADEEAFVKLVLATLKRWNQPQPVGIRPVPRSRNAPENECLVRFHFPHGGPHVEPHRTVTRPIVVALLKDLS